MTISGKDAYHYDVNNEKDPSFKKFTNFLREYNSTSAQKVTYSSAEISSTPKSAEMSGSVMKNDNLTIVNDSEYQIKNIQEYLAFWPLILVTGIAIFLLFIVIGLSVKLAQFRKTSSANQVI